MSYQSIYDFVITHTKRTPEGLIKIVEDGRERFLNRQELKSLCSELKEKIEKKTNQAVSQKRRLIHCGEIKK